jgi:hypothetical protein
LLQIGKDDDMKKILCAILTIMMLLTVACGAERQIMPVPDYPLDETAIAAVLQEVGLNWEITKLDEAPHEWITFHTFDKDGAFIAHLVSNTKDGGRFVHLALSKSHNNEYSLPEEEWERAIVLATLLYSGFESSHQIYHYFKNEFDTENTLRAPLEQKSTTTFPFDERAIWQKIVNGVYCQVVVSRAAGMQEEYLYDVILISDLATFGLERRWESGIPTN